MKIVSIKVCVFYQVYKILYRQLMAKMKVFSLNFLILGSDIIADIKMKCSIDFFPFISKK